MLFSSMSEIDLLLGLVMIIIYGLFSLRNQLVSIGDVHFFARTWPVLILITFLIDGVDIFSTDFSITNVVNTIGDHGMFIDFLLAFLTVIIVASFKSSFESTLLLLLAFVGQIGLLHSCDLVTFYINLELTNFAFLVLCGLQPNTNNALLSSGVLGPDPQTMHLGLTPKGLALNAKPGGQVPAKGSSGFSVEAALKFALLSAFSSGVLLFWFSALYLRTGTTFLFFKSASLEFASQIESFQILLALMFKLGVAPLHLWVVDIYGSVKRSLLMYISTAPKLSLFGFWISSFHGVWTDFSIGLFALFSLILGSLGAYGQPALRALFAYSTINEIGILLMALETAGFHTLYQHLFIYIITQLILWNLSDKRLFSLIAVSLAGMPPLLGFFGKGWIFGHVASTNLTFILMVALFTTGVSLVYYIRVIRLFWTSPNYHSVNNIYSDQSHVNINSLGSNVALTVNRVHLTSALTVILIFAPLLFIKPFVL